MPPKNQQYLAVSGGYLNLNCFCVICYIQRSRNCPKRQFNKSRQVSLGRLVDVVFCRNKIYNLKMDYLQLVTPAIGIGTLAYLANFFGKVITDQYSVVDDRRWNIQLSGVYFLMKLMPGVLGVYLAVNFPLGVGYWWSHLVTFLIFLVARTLLGIHGEEVSSKIYKTTRRGFEKMDEKSQYVYSLLASAGGWLGASSFSIVLFYFGTLEYISGNPYWIIITIVLIFSILAQQALNFSLSKIKDIVLVTVYLKDGSTYNKVFIIKEKDDSFRIRVDNKIILLSKNEVSRIEMVIPEDIH